MEKNKTLKVFTLAGFLLLLSGFIAFKSGAFDNTPDQENEHLTRYIEQPNIERSFVMDTPPVLSADSIKYNPAMMPSTKSMMINEPHVRVKINLDTLKPDSTKTRRFK